eukprot:6491197-Amphidinium_carterae.1
MKRSAGPVRPEYASNFNNTGRSVQGNDRFLPGIQRDSCWHPTHRLEAATTDKAGRRQPSEGRSCEADYCQRCAAGIGWNENHCIQR